MAGSTAKTGSSKKKALSVEEKLRRAEEFFHEKRDFFQLKDLEKMLSKEKGIVSRTVKEIVDTLVNDRLVNFEKIGTCNYYWSFPSAALHARKLKLQGVRADIDKLDRLETDLNESIRKATVGREETGERRKLLAEWEALTAQLRGVDAELDRFKENDPTLHAARIKDNRAKRAAANQWTDNIDTVQSYCASTFGVPKEQLREAFEIPSELEYF